MTLMNNLRAVAPGTLFDSIIPQKNGQSLIYKILQLFPEPKNFDLM